ncbi:S-layer protein domain-containing protein [Methanolapillus ohkumae]
MKNNSTTQLSLRKLFLLSILFTILAGCLCATAAADTKGSNIWDEEQRMPSTYNWTPHLYSGFYFDTDSDLYTESLEMTISTSGRTIESSNARYMTEVEPARFAYSDWGSYDFIAWIGKPYFAGYEKYDSGDKNDTAYFAKSNVSTLSDKRLYEVLINEKSERKISSGDTHNLENDYKLRISDINTNNREFRLTLEKGGSAVKNETVSSNSTFVFEKSLDNSGSIPIIAVHVRDVTDGKAVIDGIFQISENSKDVSSGKRVDAMEITNVNNTSIIMKNPSRIDLSANRNITLMEHIKIQVGDSSKLRFGLISDPITTAEKKYPSRSSVYDIYDNNMKSWTGRSYGEFSYIWSNGMTPENLTVDVKGNIGRTLNPKEISYEVLSYNSSFNYSDWGGFKSVRIAGDEYFAGYTAYNSSEKNNTTNFTSSDYNILEKGLISKVLVNNNSSRSYSVGSEISLGDGYALKLNKIEGEGSSKKLNLTLLKNGSAVENASLSENENYIRKTTFGEIGGVPQIVVRVGSIFVGSSSTEINISGIFQISDNTTDVTAGRRIDNMRVEYTSRTGFYLLNNDTIDLSRGRDIRLVGNLSLHVADSDDVRFFFFNQNGSTTQKSLKIILPDMVYPYQDIDIRVQASDGSNWINAEGVQVRVNGNSIGSTNSSGQIQYTVGESGTYNFSAEKDGYTSAFQMKSTTDPEKNLTMTAPLYIFESDSFLIFVRDDSYAYVTGASVYENNVLIGMSDENGSVSVTAKAPGSFEYKATKSGYGPGAMSQNILPYGPYFAVTNAPLSELEFFMNQRTKIPFEITNVGKEKGVGEVSISFNDQNTTKKVTLEPGESKTISYTVKPLTAGYNVITVGNQSFAFYSNESGKPAVPWDMLAIGGGILLLILVLAGGVWYFTQKKRGNQKTKKPAKSTKSAKSVSAKSATPSKSKSSKPANASQKSSTFGFLSGGSNGSGSGNSGSNSGSSSSKPKPKNTAPSQSSKSKENTHKFSSSNKPAELKNSQKKARENQEKKGKL